jgi:hypothetical protein
MSLLTPTVGQTDHEHMMNKDERWNGQPDFGRSERRRPLPNHATGN